ncbi:MAG: cytochrome c peroxidase [Candidatus Sumerlaeia bacterium]|nr:cytochrome c peroxidase [Candidatus Sumerlaeia bacterium]
MHWILAATTALLAGAATLQAQQPIDLDNLPNYASQPRPPFIRRDNTPPTNAITDAGATLGRVLFYDKRLSRNNTISCASCHHQDHGFADPAVASLGVSATTGRHSMRLVNIRFGQDPRMFWDERAANTEAQATQPIRDHGEMGFSGTLGDPPFESLLEKLAATEEYPLLFERAFGDATITEDRMQRGLAQFVRSIQSFDTKYDAGRLQAPNELPFPNFTQAENNGKALFIEPPRFNPQGVRVGGGAGCQACHRAPEFDIDPTSLSNGVTGRIGGGVDATSRRSPSLRGMFAADGSQNGPFMHDGSLATLEAVVDHYDSIPSVVLDPGISPNIDPRLTPGGNPQRLNLTAQQKADIVAFLRTLSGPAVETDARWSDPYGPDGALDIVQLRGPATGWMLH